VTAAGVPPEARRAAASELAAVAALHRAVFPDYQSSRLGPAFARRLHALVDELVTRPPVGAGPGPGPAAAAR